MEFIRNYSYYMIWNKVSVFIVMSCLLHAGFFSLFFFYNGSFKDANVGESMFVRIVDTFMPDNVNLKKGVSRGVSNHSLPNIVSRIISGGNIIPAGEKKNEVILRQAQDDNIPPPLNPLPQVEGRLDEQLRGEGQGGGELRGFSNEENYGDAALMESETSFQIEKELRDIVLTNIRKNMLYPVAARKLGIEGDVNISFRISPDGTVNNVSASGKKNDLSVLEKAAVSLINNSAPYYLSGSKKMGEAVSIQMVISYRLEDEKR